MKEKIIAFLKGSAVLTLANICTKAINFFLLPLYTKYLTPEQLGVSDSITTITSLIFPLLVLGLDSAYSAFYFDEDSKEYKHKVFSSIMTILMVTSMLPIIGIFFSKNISILIFDRETYYMIIIIALLSMCCNLWYLPFSLFLRVENRMTAFAVINATASVLMIVFNVITVSILKMGEAALIISTLAVNIIMLIFYVVISKHWPSPRDFDKNLSKKMLKYSAPLVPMVVSTWILTTSSRVILLNLLGEESVGLYGIGARFVNIINVFTNSIYMAYTTFAFSTKDEENSKEVYVVILDIMNCALTIIVSTVCMFSKEITEIMTDERYFGAYILLPGLLFAQLFYAANTIVGYGLSFQKKSNLMLLCVTVSAVISIILNFAFIPKFGVVAASITAWIGYGVMVIMTNYFSQKVYECPYNMKKLMLCNAIPLIIIYFSLIYIPFIGRLIIEILMFAGILLVYNRTLRKVCIVIKNFIRER